MIKLFKKIFAFFQYKTKTKGDIRTPSASFEEVQGNFDNEEEV